MLLRGLCLTVQGVEGSWSRRSVWLHYVNEWKFLQWMQQTSSHGWWQSEGLYSVPMLCPHFMSTISACLCVIFASYSNCVHCCMKISICFYLNSTLVDIRQGRRKQFDIGLANPLLFPPFPFPLSYPLPPFPFRSSRALIFFLHSPSFPFPPFSPPSLRSRRLKSSQRVWSGAPAEIEFGAF